MAYGLDIKAAYRASDHNLQLYAHLCSKRIGKKNVMKLFSYSVLQYQYKLP